MLGEGLRGREDRMRDMENVVAMYLGQINALTQEIGLMS